MRARNVDEQVMKLTHNAYLRQFVCWNQMLFTTASRQRCEKSFEERRDSSSCHWTQGIFFSFWPSTLPHGIYFQPRSLAQLPTRKIIILPPNDRRRMKTEAKSIVELMREGTRESSALIIFVSWAWREEKFFYISLSISSDVNKQNGKTVFNYALSS